MRFFIVPPQHVHSGFKNPGINPELVKSVRPDSGWYQNDPVHLIIFTYTDGTEEVWRFRNYPDANETYWSIVYSVTK